MKIVYMGTPDFAVAPLKKIAEAGYDIAAVFTQPDREKGRGKKVAFSDVKTAAIELGLEDKIYQPEKLRDEEYVKILKNIAPDLIVVAAYGQILSQEILDIPKYGCVNIHASLLPKYRGASPIEASIMNGDEKTGITIMYMAKGLDTGDIITAGDMPIEVYDTTESLTEKLSQLGAELIVNVIPALENGTASRTPQTEEDSCYAGKLDKEMGRLDYTRPAVELERLIRAMYPWPCAFTELGGKSLKILGAKVDESFEDKGEAPGTVINVTKKLITVKCGEAALTITKLQPEGKKPMDTVAFLNGYKVSVGEHFG